MRRAGRHELSCAACGAPLHEMKALPSAGEAPADREARTVYPAYEERRHRPAPKPRKTEERYRKAKRKRRSGRIMRKLVEEVWDTFEDIFD